MINRKSNMVKVPLDRYSSVPMFVQIAETLKRRILSGRYNQGQPSFTGEELEKEFETSSITIRKALDMLRSDGFVKRLRGLGTTVSEIIPEPVVFELNSGYRKILESIEKMRFQVKVLEIVLMACPKHIQKALLLTPEQEVWRMRRVRINEGQPFSFYTYYADPVSCAAMTMKEAKKSDIIDTFESVTGYKIARIQQSIRAVVSDLDISAALEIPFGAPVFFSENNYYSVSDKPVFFSQSYYRGDMCVFSSSRRL